MKINPFRLFLIVVPSVVLSVLVISFIDNRYGGIPIILLLVAMLFFGIFGKFKDY